MNRVASVGCQSEHRRHVPYDLDDRQSLDDALRSDAMRAAGKVLREIAPGLATFLVVEDAPDLLGA